MASQEGTSTSTAASAAQEYVVRVPKVDKKKFNVMKFNASLNIDFSKWTQVKMERENNLRDFKPGEEMPKFGAGSEYGRDLREEARKKKYGIVSKKYNADDQPWLLRIGGKAGRKFRGIKEGGVTENASYYVFTQAPDGAFEAYPIDEWYNFTPVQTYKTLNAEEAEEEFGRRDKVFNYFSIMLKKRLKNDEGAGEGESEELKKGDAKKFKGSGDLKISDMDDWMNSSDENEDDEEDDEEKKDDDDKQQKAKANAAKPGQKKKDTKKKKKKKKTDDSDDEAWEDSDDGDEEGREVDYISDESSSSEGEPDVKSKDELKGVEDEEAIRKMEQSESDEEEGGDGAKENGEEAKEDSTTPSKTDKSVAKEKKEKKDGGSSSDTSEDTSDSDDFDNDTTFQSAMFMPGTSSKKSQKKGKKDGGSHSGRSASRSNTPTKSIDKLGGGVKRPADDNKEQHTAKKARTDTPTSSQSFEGISEDAIRRYLMRKPMTASELLQKFKSKKTGLTSDQMVNTITQILKRLNPEKQMVKGKMYLSIKQS